MLVVLDNSKLVSLSSKSNLREAFQFLRQLHDELKANNKSTGKGCGCGGKAKVQSSTNKPVDFNSYKSLVANMPEADIALLKQLTGYKTIKIIYWVDSKVISKTI